MNNPGMNMEIWTQLRQKWANLDAKGHKVKVDFKLISDSNEPNKVVIIDVIQHIDGKPVTETVQRNAGEANATLGIAGLSAERLVEVYKGMLKQMHRGANQPNMDLIVIMTPTSEVSGEVYADLVHPDAPVQSRLQVDYRHYFVLNALRDKMIELTRDAWSQVRVEYHAGDLDFHFDYPKSSV